jgi:hypothetical protein
LSRTITIRNLPADLETRLEEMAREEGASLARTVIRLLMRATGLRPPERRDGNPKRQHDLDALAGTWSAEEAAEFERALAAQRTLDADVWD